MKSSGDGERRSLLARLGVLLMGIIGAAMSAPAALFVTDPLRKKGSGDKGEVPKVPITRLSEVPDLDQGGVPLRTPVVAKDLRDAWNRFPRVKLGSVWIYRRGQTLTCLSTVCPHAGCSIDYDEKERAFACPCHKSTFALDGARREGPTPRDMDRLDVEVNGEQVLCRFQRFRLATGDKEPV